jgi:hypothetical protein
MPVVPIALVEQLADATPAGFHNCATGVELRVCAGFGTLGRRPPQPIDSTDHQLAGLGRHLGLEAIRASLGGRRFDA